MKCVKCGQEISTEAYRCPNCGEPTQKYLEYVEKSTHKSKKKKKERKPVNKKKLFIGILVFVIVIAVAYIPVLTGVTKALINNGDFYDAGVCIKYLPKTNSVKELEKELLYQRGKYYCAGKEYYGIAIEDFKQIIDYKDSKEQLEIVKEAVIQDIIDVPIYDKDREAYLLSLLDKFDDAQELKYNVAKSLDEKCRYATAKEIYKTIKDYKDVNDILKQIKYGIAGNDYLGTQTFSRSSYEIVSYAYTMNFGNSIYFHTMSMKNGAITAEATFNNKPYVVENNKVSIASMPLCTIENPVWEGDDIIEFIYDDIKLKRLS